MSGMADAVSLKADVICSRFCWQYITRRMTTIARPAIPSLCELFNAEDIYG